jgi:hypothetical protein
MMVERFNTLPKWQQTVLGVAICLILISIGLIVAA